MTLELRRSEKSRPSFIEGETEASKLLAGPHPTSGSEEDPAAPSATQLSPISVALSWGQVCPPGDIWQSLETV